MKPMFNERTLRDDEYAEVFKRLKERFTIHQLEQLAVTGNLPKGKEPVFEDMDWGRVPVDRVY